MTPATVYHARGPDEGWSFTPDGYFDRKAIIRSGDGQMGEVQFWHKDLLYAKEPGGGLQFANGQRGEIQFWPPGMFAAKEHGGGHALYKEYQALPNDSPKKGALNQKMKALYSGVEAGMPSEWRGLFG